MEYLLYPLVFFAWQVSYHLNRYQFQANQDRLFLLFIAVLHNHTLIILT